MNVYVVQEGDTITSIANTFKVSETRIAQENFVTDLNNLVVGDTLVITYPTQIYVIKDGDSLEGIADSFGIPLMQLYRNNPYLWEKESLTVGEMLVISYNTQAEITTNGYVFSFVGLNTLRITLPYLTYLTIMNYKMSEKGNLEPYYNESEITTLAKQFGVQPLLLISSLDISGNRNPQVGYEILINPEAQLALAKNMIQVMKEKGYYGANMVFTVLNERTQRLYIELLKRIVPLINEEGFTVFVTVDSGIERPEGESVYEKLDYTEVGKLVKGLYLTSLYWGTLTGPPRPVSSIPEVKEYLDYVKKMVDPKKLNISFPLIGYIWTLPYIRGYTKANSYTINAAINLAYLTDSTILFDEVSKTPYFSYEYESRTDIIKHEVRFVDARTINEIIKLTIENALQGTGLWNIMSFYPQIWIMFNSIYRIIKLLPEE